MSDHADKLRDILELTDCGRGQWEPLLDALVAERDRVLGAYYRENDGRLAAEAERDELRRSGLTDLTETARKLEAAEARVTELEAAYEAVVKERDSWRILAEGWKLTNDVEHQGDNQSK